MSSKRLVLLAHGSTDPKWKEPFESLAQSVAATQGSKAVRLAFMQLATPSLEDAVAEANGDCVGRLDVLPIFLSTGSHIARDIPELARLAQVSYPKVTINLLPPVGADVRMAELLRTLALEAAGEVMK